MPVIILALTAARPVGSAGCGMAAVAAPKICREREKRRKLGRKKEKRGERKERRKGERKGEKSKRERCIRPMGVKDPHRTVKRL